MADSPWSDLGIGPTADRERIFAAYRAKVDKLGLSSPISAFTRLSEARDKALILARQIRPQNDNTRISARGILVTAAEGRATDRDTDGEYARSEWRDGPFAAIDDGWAKPSNGDPVSRSRGHSFDTFSTVVGRLRLFVALFFLAIYTGVTVWHWISPEFPRLVSAVPHLGYDPGPEFFKDSLVEDTLSDPARRARADAASIALFGDGYDLKRLKRENYGFAHRMLSELEWPTGDSDLDNARMTLRVVMTESANHLGRRQLLELARLKLMWLEAAQAEGLGQCREVTGGSFFGGEPRLGSRAQSIEQRVARDWLRSRYIVWSEEEGALRDVDIPQWAVQGTTERTGLTADQIRASLDDFAAPQRCRVSIALLETLLERERKAPSDLLAKL